MLLLSKPAAFKTMSLAHMDHWAPLWQDSGKGHVAESWSCYFLPTTSGSFLPPWNSSLETLTMVFAVLLGILFVFLLLSYSFRTPQAPNRLCLLRELRRAINEGAFLPYFIKVNRGSWLSLPPAESVIRTLSSCCFPAKENILILSYYISSIISGVWWQQGIGSQLLSGCKPCRCESQLISGPCLAFTPSGNSPQAPQISWGLSVSAALSSTPLRGSWLVLSLQKGRELACSACDEITSQSFVVWYQGPENFSQPIFNKSAWKHSWTL